MRRLSGVAAFAAMMMTASCGWVDAGVDGNKPPSVASTATGDYSVDEGGVLEVSPREGLLTNVSDGGNNPPQVRIVSEPAHGTLRLTGEGGFVYEHDGSEGQSDTFSYVANDGIEDSEPVSVTIGVTAVNDPPVIVGAPGDLTVEEDGVLELSVDQFDIADEDNTDTGDFKLIVHPGADYRADGVLVQPARDYDGALTVGVSVTDGSATSETVQLAVDVTPVNDPPVIVSQTAPLQTEEDVAVVLPVDAFDISDVDDDSGDLALVALAGSGYSVDGLRITPEPDFNGALTVNVAARDNETTGEAFAAVVEVLPVDDPPVLVTPIGNQTATEDQPFTLDLTTFFDEPDGDTLTYSQKGLPPSLVLDKTAGAISGTPQYTEGGRSYKVTVTAADSGGQKVDAEFRIDVGDVNRPPAVTSPIGPQHAIEGEPFHLDFKSRFSDPDGDELTFTLNNAPDVFRLEKGKMEGTPGQSEADGSPYEVTIIASDGEMSVKEAFTLTVENVNQSPAVDRDIPVIDAIEDETFSVDVSPFATDPDGDRLRLDISGVTGWMHFDGDVLSGTPGFDDAGSYSLKLTATDPDGLSGEGNMKVEVAEMPAPIAKCWDVGQDDELEGDLETDRDRNDDGKDDEKDDKLTFSFPDGQDADTLITDKGAVVTLLDNTTGAFRYDPVSGGERGTDTFLFKVENSSGNYAVGEASVVVHQTVMTLGDSLTLGLIDGVENKPEIGDRVGYRGPLYEVLRTDGYTVDFVGSVKAGDSLLADPETEGHAEAAASDIAVGVRQWLDANPADVILFQIGTDRPLDTLVSDVVTVLDEIDRWEAGINGNHVTVYVSTLPGDANLVSQFNDALRTAVERRTGETQDDIVLVDQDAALAYPDDFAADGRHPNASGYAKMAETWFVSLKGRGHGRGLDKCP